jgi:CubicO group peptidase (beta-lactamase class C family)
MLSMTSAPIDRAVVEAIFAEHGALNGVPSLAWGIVRDGRLLHAGGLRADEVTAFRIASMTKSFTAAAVLLLRDEGRLALDDPIARSAPELTAVRTPTADGPAITIRHLLTMSAGFATDDPWADRHLAATDPEMDRFFAAGVAFAVAPGTAMEYSNLGYGMLGRIVERVTGRRLQDIVSERLLRPLGLSHTAWTRDALPPGTAIATGYRRRDGDLLPETPLGDGGLAPMGGLWSTVADLARWVGFLCDAFPPRDDLDDGPLCRASRREMQQVGRAMAPRQITSRDGRARTVVGGYGMGLMVTHHPALGWIVDHSGGLPGFGSNMRWVPGLGLGAIVLGNLTYPRLGDATLAVLDALAAQGAIRRPPPAVHPALAAAAERLVALLGRWDDADADALFAGNVFLDDARERRRAAAERLRTEHGVLAIERIDADSWTTGTAVVRGARRTLSIDLKLSPETPTRVQWYEVRDPPP